jgi:hypothetical protein
VQDNNWVIFCCCCCCCCCHCYISPHPNTSNKTISCDASSSLQQRRFMLILDYRQLAARQTNIH